MQDLKIESGAKTPEVHFQQSGKIEISGRSIPENAVDFYKPLYAWLDEYSNSPSDDIEVNIRLEYFNTSSSKCLLDVFKKAEIISRDQGSKVQVNWYFEEGDEDMQEAGEDYDIIINIPFNFVEVPEL